MLMHFPPCHPSITNGRCDLEGATRGAHSRTHIPTDQPNCQSSTSLLSFTAFSESKRPIRYPAPWEGSGSAVEGLGPRGPSTLTLSPISYDSSCLAKFPTSSQMVGRLFPPRNLRMSVRTA